MRRLAYLIACSLVAMLVALPFAGAQGQNVTVSMEDNFFDQANITVEQGTTVTWVQNGENPHTTTSYDGLWDSGMMAGGSGATSSFTFDEPGTYDYYCIPHESQGMVGTVTVTAGAEADDDAADDSVTAPATGSAAATAEDDVDDDSGAAQYAGADQYDDDAVAELPDTGGVPLLAFAALALAGGALGLGVLRRML